MKDMMVGYYGRGTEMVRTQGGPVPGQSGNTRFTDFREAEQVARQTAVGHDYDAVIIQNGDGSFSVHRIQEMSRNDAWRTDLNMDIHASSPNVVTFAMSRDAGSNVVHWDDNPSYRAAKGRSEGETYYHPDATDDRSDPENAGEALRQLGNGGSGHIHGSEYDLDHLDDGSTPHRGI